MRLKKICFGYFFFLCSVRLFEEIRIVLKLIVGVGVGVVVVVFLFVCDVF